MIKEGEYYWLCQPFGKYKLEYITSVNTASGERYFYTFDTKDFGFSKTVSADKIYSEKWDAQIAKFKIKIKKMRVRISAHNNDVNDLNNYNFDEYEREVFYWVQEHHPEWLLEIF